MISLRIRGILMHGVQKPASDSGHIYARCAETHLRFRPQIQDTFMHGVQKLASDSGHIYARCAETRLRFMTYLCTVCINLPQFQGTFLPPMHKSLPDFRLVFQTLKRDDGTFRLVFVSPIWLFQKNRLPLWR